MFVAEDINHLPAGLRVLVVRLQNPSSISVGELVYGLTEFAIGDRVMVASGDVVVVVRCRVAAAAPLRCTHRVLNQLRNESLGPFVETTLDPSLNVL